MVIVFNATFNNISVMSRRMKKGLNTCIHKTINIKAIVFQDENVSHVFEGT